MTDDLVKRLRVQADSAYISSVLEEAADCIEELEAALAKVAEGYTTEWSTSSVTNMFDIAQILSERIVIARKALEWKDD